jgi:deoxyribodipyrimidine photolyase-related protein
MKEVGIIFPNQLFEENILISKCETIYLVEEYLFFKQYLFHKQKIAFHRASMKFYESHLLKKGKKIIYIEANNELSDIRKLIVMLHQSEIKIINYIDPSDNWLEKRILESCEIFKIQKIKFSSPLFINSTNEIYDFFSTKKRMFQTDFYKSQRQNRKILMETEQKPFGGRWTFDDENRLKYPKGKIPPKIEITELTSFYNEAFNYVESNFSNNYGKLNRSFIFPSTFEESKKWLFDFFKTRFSEFGAYEDAIVSSELILHHSLLTPLLNSGLLTPKFVIDEAMTFASSHEIPINSLEGFIRQILGWREFIRAVYELKGTEERTKNYWGFKRKIPESFWNATTGIEPIDVTIQKVLETAYCHHIERLMVLGNFMLLCEFDPDEVYRWFMELFVDSYDWVMVPNVYGMSQFADGGLMSTKPYISGSNYLMKMSDYKKGPWQEVWDGLFWRFMNKQRDFFLKNPRLSMLVRSFDKMPEEKQNLHLQNAEFFLKSLK